MMYALITGGSRGIGRAVCLEIAGMGLPVLINYRSRDDEAEKTKKEIEDSGGRASLLKFDVSDPGQIESSLERWQESHPDDYMGVLVNNAGIRKDNLMVWMQDEDWKHVMDTNLNAFFYVTRKLLKNMIVRKYGRIVNIVSLSGQKGQAGQVNYAAAKGAVISGTKALALEVGRKNVTVNAVAPGFIRTDMTEDILEKDFRTLIPMRRFGQPEEVAGVVGFLISEKASYITGEIISVNGGLYT